MGVHCLFPIITIGNGQCRGTLSDPYGIGDTVTDVVSITYNTIALVYRRDTV